MEFENQSIFTPENLYGKYSDEISFYLNESPSCLIGDTALKFKTLILQHCEHAWLSGEYTLPSFGNVGEWLNTGRPLDFEADLSKRVYLMDFFTYCCINCIHILPYLKEVEKEHAHNSTFVVLGIHSPKFPNEKHLDRVKEAILKNDIKHPVLNDPESKLWKMYEIMCWPTVFIVGPGHTPLFVLVGEGQIDKISFLCHHILKFFTSFSVELDLSPLPILPPEKPKEIKTSLLFPGSISTYGSKHLVISDTGHNRLLIVSKHLKVKETIGSGLRGCNDGPFNSASFNFPNGSAQFNGSLYVADTGNHAIRKIDLENKTVSTVFTKKEYVNNSHCKSDFQSPWDVCVGPKMGSDFDMLNTLYIAVAGSHQIWALDLDSDPSNPEFCIPFAGSGKEENRQNLYRLKAGFAQPSGITYSSLSPGYLYVADSESSTVKSIDLKKNGAVKILVGGGHDPSDLFQYGDMDGTHVDVKLQHPMSVCVVGLNLLALTDTYNHKIKLIDTALKKCFTLNGNLNLCEPNGICFMDHNDDYNFLREKRLFIADTNNHRIVSIRLYDNTLSQVISEPIDFAIESPALPNIEMDPQTILPLAYDGKVLCHFKWDLDPRFKLNHEGCDCEVKHEGDGAFNFEFLSPERAFGIYQPSLRMMSHAQILEEKGIENPKSKVLIVCHVAYCDKRCSVCSYTVVAFKVWIHFEKSGPKGVNLFFTAKI